MSLLNAVLRGLADVLLLPFRPLPPWLGLGAVALLCGIIMLLVVKRTTDQKALAAVKRQIHACIFEIRLFNDDMRAIFRAQNEVLRRNLTYLWLSLPSVLWMIVPFLLLIAQMEYHYGYRGLTPDEPVLVKVTLRDGAVDAAAGRPELRLEVPDGLRVETPGVWIPSAREMDWRIAAAREGDYELTVALDGSAASKTVRADDRVVRRSPVRHAGGFVDSLWYPAEPPLDGDSPFERIEVTYPETASVLGLKTWLWLFILLMIVFAFALKGVFGVVV